MKKFQPTLSAMRVTWGFDGEYADIAISTHTLRDESDLILDRLAKRRRISTHTLREESDVV